MKLNKHQQRRISNAIKRGRVATMQRLKEKENNAQEATQPQIKVSFVRG